MTEQEKTVSTATYRPNFRSVLSMGIGDSDMSTMANCLLKASCVLDEMCILTAIEPPLVDSFKYRPSVIYIRTYQSTNNTA